MEKSEAKHQSGLKGKFYMDREILHAVEFKPTGTFEAFYAAEQYLKELGYAVGSMCCDEPIGFMYDYDYVAKWHKIREEEKNLLDGILLAQHEFREGGAIILFFNPPRY